LTVTGQVVAQTLNVQQVTSSIVFSSGSNIFGTNISNTQQFTGSMLITGSNITANVGSACFSSNVCAPAFVGGTVSGTSGTFTGKLSVSQASTDFVGEFINTSATNPYGLRVIDASGAANNYPLFQVVNNAGTVEYFRVNSGTGLSTFSGVVCSACTVCAPTAIFSGCVGIGITSPVATLDAVSAVTGTYSSSTQQVVARFYNLPSSLGSGNNSAFLSLQTSADGGGGNPVARIGVVGESYGSNNGAFVVATRDFSGVTERMRITSGGNVGIGETHPGSKL
jgi:hypothetical protein